MKGTWLNREFYKSSYVWYVLMLECGISNYESVNRWLFGKESLEYFCGTFACLWSPFKSGYQHGKSSLSCVVDGSLKKRDVCRKHVIKYMSRNGKCRVQPFIRTKGSKVFVKLFDVLLWSCLPWFTCLCMVSNIIYQLSKNYDGECLFQKLLQVSWTWIVNTRNLDFTD